MEKKIKIKSSSLTPLNEALQKLKLNDTITDFTPVIVEADGKFTSIMNTKEDFNPNDLGSAFETQEQSEEQKETKEQLLNKAKDALKQTLTNSEELNSILKKIQDLAKEDNYNTWEVNKEHNTATLKSKNAMIFKQNNNLCLSHNGKIELFHSVNELHDWLKEKGYPLPGKDIVIHESVQVKETEERNWLDLLNDFKKKELINKSKEPIDKYENDILSDDTYAEYQAKIDRYNELDKKLNDPEREAVLYLASLQSALADCENRSNTIQRNLLKIQEERDKYKNAWKDNPARLKKLLDDLDKKENELLEKQLEISGKKEYEKDSNNRIKKDENGKWIVKNKIVGEKEELHNDIIEAEKRLEEIRNNRKNDNSPEALEYKELSKDIKEIKNLVHRHFQSLSQRKMDKVRDDFVALSKPIAKDILQADKRNKLVIKPNRSLLHKEEDVEECCGGTCVSTTALGPATIYTANKKKEAKEEELQESFPSLIPGEDKVYEGRRPAVNKFLTWFKRNQKAIESGEIKLPDDFENIFDNLIEPTFMNNASDSVSKVWNKIILNRLEPLAANLANKNKIPEKTILQNLVDNPNEKICIALSQELNSKLPNTEEYDFGKVQLIPGKPLLLVSKKADDVNNPNYIQRQNWQKAWYQAKIGGDSDKSEVMVKTFNNLKNFVKNSQTTSEFTPEELDLIKKYNLQSKTEAIFESASKYPWLNKILNQRLVEDDSPADFATGSPISSDIGSTDTSTSSATSTTSTTTDNTSATPDIDFGDASADNTPGFGDINIDAGGYSPDEGNEEAAPIPTAPEYKIIDVLLNDDNNDVKVKVQNIETKETELKDLEDIDV